MKKSIILCCDGTNNQMTGSATNVLRLYRSLVRDERQLTYYDPGVGTLADPMALSRVRKFIERKLDAAIGRSLCETFSNAYRFLAMHYQPGDDIYMFGFSRGSYNCRAVAGAINMLGLLRPELLHLVAYVWAIYANDGGAYAVQTRFGGAARFREMFCLPEKPRVKLLGLWDTVSSFGWFWNFQSLPYTASNPSVDSVRHAVSIDEHRAAYPTNLFSLPPPPEFPDRAPPSSSPLMKQVWFPGVHSDVGGGYLDKEGGLSKVAFDWMIKELKDLGDVRLHQEIVDKILGADGILSQPDPTAQMHESLSGWWNLLEWLPRKGWTKTESDEPNQDAGISTTTTAETPRPLWVGHWVPPHWYRRRRIPADAWLHPAVRKRQRAGGYSPSLPATCVDLVHTPGRGYLPKEN